MKKGYVIALAIVLGIFILAMILINGTTTSWGKVVVKKIAFLTGDGDKINALFYKPKAASETNKVPLAIIAHGGSDMLEQASGYAIELSRRGYAVMTYDYQGQADSDVATGKAEGNGGRSGYGKRGLNTIWNAVQLFNFVDFDHIVTMGHSGGGMHTFGFATDHQDEIFLQLNIGQNNYGPATIEDHNFNFVNILGDSDESALVRAPDGKSNESHFQVEQLKRMFFNEYEKNADGSYKVAKENLPYLELNKVYTVVGSDGNTWTRTAYMPDSCHAYYLTDDDAVRTVIYGICSQVGGLDAGVNSYDDYKKISLVYRWHDLGYALELIAMIGLMGIVAVALTETKFFKSMELKPLDDVGFKKKSPMWWVALALMVLIPPALYTTGKLPQDKFLGITVKPMWLLDGNCSAWLCWQWLVSLVFIVLFLIYHFAYGKKHGGNARNYGLATSDDGKFSIVYILKSALYGLLVVGSGYLLMAFATHYTNQGLHIATFMLRTLAANRTGIFFIYFLMSVPYFLSSSLAAKSLGIRGDGTMKTNVKNVGIMSAIAIGGLFILWVVFILSLCRANYVLPMFAVNRLYILGVGLVPIMIGIGIGNMINVFISQKTNSIWPGLFSAVIWGTWTITACAAVLKYHY